MSHTDKRCDVLIIGAGPAGMAAAVTAARKGADTLLVEKNDIPGGTPAICCHRYICGLYAQSDECPTETLNPGLPREIAERLGGAPQKMGRVYVHPFQVRDWITICKTIIDAEDRLQAVFSAKAVATDLAEGGIKTVTVQLPEEKITITPKAVIDCSGTGSIIKACGNAFEETPLNTRQLAGFTVHIGGLAPTNDPVDDLVAVKVPYILRRAADKKQIPAYLQYTTFIPGKSDDGFLKINQPAGNPAGQLKEDIATVHQILKEGLPAFGNTTILKQSSKAVDREGPRLKGAYTLTADDVLTGAKFSDCACQGAWPIELWSPDQRLTLRYLENNSYYDIPERCLCSPDITNLFAAGLLIATSREAQGSTRVMGACLATGEAAGKLAVRALN